MGAQQSSGRCDRFGVDMMNCGKRRAANGVDEGLDFTLFAKGGESRQDGRSDLENSWMRTAYGAGAHVSKRRKCEVPDKVNGQASSPWAIGMLSVLGCSSSPARAEQLNTLSTSSRPAPRSTIKDNRHKRMPSPARDAPLKQLEHSTNDRRLETRADAYSWCQPLPVSPAPTELSTASTPEPSIKRSRPPSVDLSKSSCPRDNYPSPLTSAQDMEGHRPFVLAGSYRSSEFSNSSPATPMAWQAQAPNHPKLSLYRSLDSRPPSSSHDKYHQSPRNRLHNSSHDSRRTSLPNSAPGKLLSSGLEQVANGNSDFVFVFGARYPSGSEVPVSSQSRTTAERTERRFSQSSTASAERTEERMLQAMNALALSQTSDWSRDRSGPLVFKRCIAEMCTRKWTIEKQDLFCGAIAALVDSELADVRILQVRDKAGKRLLASDLEVTFSVNASSDSQRNRIKLLLNTEGLEQILLDQADMRMRSDLGGGPGAVFSSKFDWESSMFRNGYSLQQSYNEMFENVSSPNHREEKEMLL